MALTDIKAWWPLTKRYASGYSIPDLVGHRGGQVTVAGVGLITEHADGLDFPGTVSGESIRVYAKAIEDVFPPDATRKFWLSIDFVADSGSIAVDKTLAGNWETGSSNRQFRLYVTNSSGAKAGVQVSTDGSAGTLTSVLVATTLVAGTRYRLVGHWDGTTLAAQLTNLDAGTSASNSAAFSGTPFVGTGAEAGRLYIGRSGTARFDGRLKNLMLGEGELSADDLSGLAGGWTPTITPGLVDVVALGGQSNGTGTDEVSDMTDDSAAQTAVIDYRMDNTQRPHLVRVVPGLMVDTGVGGDTAIPVVAPEVGVARAVDAEPTSLPVIIIKYTLGGTFVAPAEADWLPYDTGTTITTFRESLIAALAELAHLGYTVRYLDMLWIQGEADADSATYAPALAANTGTLFDAIKAEFGARRFAVARLSDRQTFVSELTTSQAQQDLLAASRTDVTLVNTDDLDVQTSDAHPVGDGFGDLHYTADSTVELGRRLMRALFDANTTRRRAVPGVVLQKLQARKG